MFKMVHHRDHFATMADVAEFGDTGRLFGRAPLAGMWNPYLRVDSRPANRKSAEASLRQASQVCGLVVMHRYCMKGQRRIFSCICHCEQWTDLSSIELIVSSTNLVTMSNSSDHTSKMNDDVASRFLPDADWQFDVTDWPHAENRSYESPPYSHEIYAGFTPSIDYPVDLNDIDAAFDCDISTLDAYLHSPPSCSNSTELLAHTQPSTSSPYDEPPASQPSTTLETDPVEEFFPDLRDASVPSASQREGRRRNLSVGSTPSSTSRYSPYSIDSTLDADTAYNEYRIRRDRNNLASQRSRQKRVEKARQMKDQKETLERRNIELKTLLNSLEVQVADYKRMVLMIVSKSGK